MNYHLTEDSYFDYYYYKAKIAIYIDSYSGFVHNPYCLAHF